jgi:hypothetical protein
LTWFLREKALKARRPFMRFGASFLASRVANGGFVHLSMRNQAHVQDIETRVVLVEQNQRFAPRRQRHKFGMRNGEGFTLDVESDRPGRRVAQ